MAHLNKGIVLTIHATASFMVAFADYLLFGIELRGSKIVGMVLMLACVMFVSMSTGTQHLLINDDLPAWIPFSLSFTIPFAQAIKYMATKKLMVKLSP